MRIKQFIRRKKKCRIIKKLAETVGVTGGVLVWCSVEGIDLTTLELWRGVIGVIIGMALVTEHIWNTEPQSIGRTSAYKKRIYLR